MIRRVWNLAVASGSVAAVAGAVHAGVNAVLLRRPSRTAERRPHTHGSASPPTQRTLHPRISILLPVRNEADRLEPCLRALLAQTVLLAGEAELVVLDDGSTDGTAELAHRLIADRAGTGLHVGKPLPDGWMGKAHACQQLAELADHGSDVFVFVDADVVLEPDAVELTVELLCRHALDLVSPYPRQQAVTISERLIQPLLQWSWLTFLPLRLAEQSRRQSLTAANGQLLAVRRDAYIRAGAHAAIRRDVLDDIALMRAVKATGGRGGVADGTSLATCRMYRNWSELRAGYGKSLWRAFGSPLAATAVITLLGGMYILPAIAALRGSKVGLAGYAAGVAGRMISARRTGGCYWPDAFAHPASITVLGWLTADSLRHSARNSLTWRDRPVLIRDAGEESRP